MKQPFPWKSTLVAAVVVIAIWSIFQYGIKQGLDLKGGTSFLLKMDLSKIDAIGRGTALDQAVEILRKRVDRFGVAEPVIQQIPPDRILVQLPGLDEARRIEAQQTIERTAYLEFRLVHEDNDKLVSDSQSDPRFMEPVGYKKLVHEDDRNGQPIKRTYYVKVRPEMTGKHVARAFVQYDELGRPYVAMSFDKEGAEIFGRVTSANVGRQLGIILDGELYSAPVIQDAIIGGNGQIKGSFSHTQRQ